MLISVSPTDGKRDLLLPIALAAAATVVAQVAIIVTTGVSQELFELARAPDAYAELARAHGGWGRLIFGVDSAFIPLYLAFFLLASPRLAARAGWPLVGTMVGGVVLFALLDALENQHILSLFALADARLPLDPRELAAQMTISQLKFHVSYVALFLFGLALPTDSLPGKLVAASCLLLLLPLGIACLLVTGPAFFWLNLARWSLYGVGLPLGALALR